METLLAIKYGSFKRRGIRGSLYGIRTSKRTVIDILRYKFLKLLCIYRGFIFRFSEPKAL